MIVDTRHAVNGNPTVPPFPEQMEMAMFGTLIIYVQFLGFQLSACFQCIR